MRRRRVPVEAELDVIPVMSLIVHLIPMILLSVSFVKLAQIPTDEPVLPTSTAASQAAFSEQQEQIVSIRITTEGFIVAGQEGGDPRLPCAGACTPSTYDYTGLTRAMQEAKRAHPEETRVVVAPAQTIPYEVVIGAMSAARGEDGSLFPSPLLAAP